MFKFRVLLVVLTAVFMSFHTQIFIHRIEPNPVFSWLASLLIEGMLISLALMNRTVLNRVLLAAVFLVSVVSASASFVVRNEQLLDSFFSQKRVIQQLREDLNRTERAYTFGQKYTTRTLQRERALSDELREMLRGQTGDITLVNTVIFFVFVLVLQSVSVYTATTLKQRNGTPETIQHETTETPVSVSPVSRETIHPETRDTHPDTAKRNDLNERIHSMKMSGMSYRQIARETGLTVSKIQRILKPKI